MKKVIIIGAGPAGLTAGYELLNGEEGKDYEIEDGKVVEKTIIKELCKIAIGTDIIAKWNMNI